MIIPSKAITIDNLQIVSVICFGIQFSEKEIKDLMNFLSDNGYSKYHTDFIKEFFTLIDKIFVAMVGSPELAASIFTETEANRSNKRK